MHLVIGPLKKAFQSLVKAVERSQKDLTDLEVRDACIQRFEYTYELSIKMLKRYLESESAVLEQIDQMNYRDLIRMAAEQGVLQNVESWFQFREARNTSHVYDEYKAKMVYELIPKFIVEVKIIIGNLEKRLSYSNDTLTK